MSETDNPVVIPIEADTSGFEHAMKDLEKSGKRFGSVFSSSLRSAITSGKSLEDVLKSLVLRMSDVALSAAMKPLENAASNAFSALVQSIGASLAGPSANASPTPFANGGIVSKPTLFNSGSSLGLMGEAGAEAIMPLARDRSGRLGVRTEGPGAPVNVTFNISTPDPVSFRKSEAQISTMLARTLSRSRRVQ